MTTNNLKNIIKNFNTLKLKHKYNLHKRDVQLQYQNLTI